MTGPSSQGAGRIARTLQQRFPTYDFTVSYMVALSWGQDDPKFEKFTRYQITALVPILKGRRVREVEFTGRSFKDVLDKAVKGLSGRRIERESAREDREA